MRRFLLFILLLSPSLGLAQTYTYPAQESANVFTNTNQFTLGITVGPILFSQLASISTNTSLIYVTDATFGSSPCTGGGTGALAMRINGVWQCSVGGGGGGGSYTATTPVQISGLLISCPNCVNTTPASTQAVTQPVGTTFSSNSIQNVHYATTAENWSQHPSGTLTGATLATVTLTPCPDGIDGRDTLGVIYVTDNASPSLSEPVHLAGGGSCIMGGTTGTVKFTPVNSHVAGYTLGSASSGIYESIAAQKNNSGTGSSGNAAIVTGPASGGNSGGTFNLYKVKGTIVFSANNVSWDGSGTLLECSTRDACIQFVPNLGTPAVIRGIRMVSDLDINGWPIASTECDINNTSGFDPTHDGMTTIVTTVPHAIVAGDIVDILRTDNSHFWGGSMGVNTNAPTRVAGVDATHIYYSDHNCSNGGVGYATQTTPGYINILNAPILDNGEQVSMIDVSFNKPGSGNTLFTGHFNEGLTIMNDQAATVERLANGGLSSGSVSACTTTNPYCGSMIYAPGPFLNAAVLWLSNLNLSLNCAGNGIYAQAGNTLHINNSVVQGQSQFGMNIGSRRGGFGTNEIDDVYSESGTCVNPDTGSAGDSVGLFVYGTVKFTGGEGPQGFTPQFSTGGGTTYYYWLITTDSSAGSSAPLFMGQGAPTGTTQTVFWPRAPNTVTTTQAYTLIRTAVSGNSPTPTLENCLGGSTTACGVIPGAASLPQCAGLSCTFTDDVTVATTSAAAVIPGAPTYIPDFMFWPGSVVIAGSGGNLQFDGQPLLPGATSLAGKGSPVAQTFTLGSLSPLGYTQALGGNVTLLDEKNSNTLLNTKGRVILERPYAGLVYQGHYITLVDSDPLSNLASATKRAALNAADTYIGNDLPGAALNAAGFALGSPVSVSTYINAGPDNTSWLERITTSLKEIKVPTLFDSSLTVPLGCVGCGPFSLPTPTTDNFNRTDPAGVLLIHGPGAQFIEPWSGASTYAIGTVATIAGTTYIATATSTNQSPPNVSFWTEIPLGANWTTLLGSWAILPGPFHGTSGGLLFQTNYASFSATTTELGIQRAYAYYSGTTFNADQYISSTMNPANSLLGICVRMAASTPITAYCANSGSGIGLVTRFVAGAGTTLFSYGSAFPGLSTIKLQVQGSTISLYINGALVFTGSDTSITSGQPGMYGQNTITPDNLIDNIVMGSATWTGTVSNEIVTTAFSAPQVSGYYEAGVLNTGEKVYTNKQTLTTGAATHTLANSFTFTSNATFGCTCTDQTAANACQAVPASATTVTLAGTGSDVLWLSCSGH